MQRIVLASGNAGKLREIGQLLAPLQMTLVPQSDLGIAEAAEPYPTFVENALTKARHAAQHAGLPALADDSGLCVAALDGAPGIYSARFAGTPSSDVRNNAKLVDLMAAHTDRRAYYVCVLAFVRHALDPCPILCEGVWAGEIVATPAGSAGFGYDPHFYLPDLACTAAQLSPDRKNALSHRGQAMRALLERLAALR